MNRVRQQAGSQAGGGSATGSGGRRVVSSQAGSQAGRVSTGSTRSQAGVVNG